ncbi:MAG: hypothetical protein R3E01_02260 [Pirellulaceae bacterium]
MMDESHFNQSTDASRYGHEPNVVNAHLLKLSGSGIVLLVASVLLLVYATTRFLVSQMPSAAGPDTGIQPTHPTTGPQVTAEQPQLLRELRQSEQQRLTNYQWIDEPAGIARIPINRAMDILAKQGLPKDEQKSEQNDGDKPK